MSPFVTALLLFVSVVSSCQYYAYSPTQTCFSQITYSNYYYCNLTTNTLYHKQYGNSDCSGDAAYDGELCNPLTDSTCVGSCVGDPCEYILFKNYNQVNCNKSKNAAEVAYVTNICHPISGSGYSSAKWECNGNQMDYTTYSDNACTSAVNTETNSLTTIETDCQDIEFHATCVETITTTETLITTTAKPITTTKTPIATTETLITTSDMDDFMGVDANCPYYGNTPLNVCIGNKGDTQSYSNYFYCNDSDYLYWKQYSNEDCSDTEAYDIPLCDTTDDDIYCPASCDGEMCQYMKQRYYTGCDKDADLWAEVAYVFGYCINLSTQSLIMECKDYDGEDDDTDTTQYFIYTQYTDTECSQTDFDQTIAVDGYPTLFETDCVDTYIYAECVADVDTSESSVGYHIACNGMFLLWITVIVLCVC